MKKLAFIILLAPLFLSAQKKPKLIVGIVVDQMRYEMLDRFSSDFGADGFNLLSKDGMRYDSCTFNYVPTYTGPGHATIYSGANPSMHGILSNDIYLPQEQRSMYCVEDKSVHPVGAAADGEGHSPKNLRIYNFGDSLKIKDPECKVFTVAIKDRSAILNGGKKADAAYWMAKNGAFVTSSYYMEALPEWVVGFNNNDYAFSYLNSSWPLFKSPESYTSSLPDNAPFEGTRLGDRAVFPYDLKTLLQKEGNDGVAFTPFGNTMLTDFAIQAIHEENLGADKHTDILAINYSSTDYIGHDFGPQSVEVQDAYLRLDKEIARLIAKLDKEIGRDNYVFFLTSDHGAANTPSDTNFTYVSHSELRETINAFTRAQYGQDLVAHIGSNQVWLNDELIYELNIDKEMILMELRSYLATQTKTPLAQVFTQFEIENCGMPECRYFQNAFDHNLSGDLFYVRPYGQIERGGNSGTTHGTQYLYDTHVPLLLFGGNVTHGKSKETVHPNEIISILKPYLKGN